MPYKFHWDWLINKDFRPFLEAFFKKWPKFEFESAAPVFDQITPDQVQSGPKHVLYHHWEREGDLKKLTRPGELRSRSVSAIFADIELLTPSETLEWAGSFCVITK